MHCEALLKLTLQATIAQRKIVACYYKKTAALIEMQFGMLSRVGSGNCVLDKGARWRHLAIMIEPSVCVVC